MVIDPSAPYASGVRTALPHARIAVDHWHLVRLANDMVTEVRQRVARQRHGHRGINADPVWAHRRMLLTAGNRLSTRQLTRLREVLDTDDPTDEIGAAWGCKEFLRQLLAEHDPDQIRHRLWRFYDACPRADMPETTPGWSPRLRPGGRPSPSPSPSRSPTPAPRASTASSNRSKASAGTGRRSSGGCVGLAGSLHRRSSALRGQRNWSSTVVLFGVVWVCITSASCRATHNPIGSLVGEVGRQ